MALVIADLHGRADLLEALVAHCPKDQQFVFIGDAVDRGPRNRDTIRLLSALRDEGRMLLLKGNHEDMIEKVDAAYERFYNEPQDSLQYNVRRADARSAFENWFRNGGETVILEYGGFETGSDQDAFGVWGLPPELIDFCKRCQLSHTENGILVAHAAPATGRKPGMSEDEWSMWARPEDGPFALPQGVRLSVHGHTPVPQPVRIKDSVFIDMGAYWTGALCTFDLATEKITVYQGRGDVPLERLETLAAVGEHEPQALPYEVVALS